MNPSSSGPTPSRWPRRLTILGILLLVGATIAGLVLRTMNPDRESAEAAKKALAPPGEEKRHPYAVKLIPSVRRESLAESIQNVGFFDDGVYASSFVKEQHGRCLFSYSSRFLPALARVRKIVSEGSPQKSLVGPLLKQKLVDAVEGEAYGPIDLKVNDPTVADILSKPDWRFAKTIDGPAGRATYGPAAAYLLSELRCFDALPLMGRVFELREPLPLSRLFLFYAMHVMVFDHPREALSAEAIQALGDYRNATAKIPPPVLASVPAWDVPLTDPSKWQVVIPATEAVSEQQPQVLLHYYSMDLSPYDSKDRQKAHPEVEKWFQKLKAFLRLAYPEYR